MMKFARIGAAAMAMALSITLVAPITANAEVTWTKDDKGNKTWTNEDTKKSLSDKDYILGTDETQYEDLYEDFEYNDDESVAEEVLASELKTKTIATNSYNETVELKTTKDVAKYESFKSNKKALKIKVLKKEEYTDNEKKRNDYDFMSKDKKTFGYRNEKGEIVTTTYDKLPKGYSSGEYKIRLYTKKAGTYKVKYKAVLKDGTTVNKSFKVIAKEDSYAIKSVTFAGKLIYSTDDVTVKGDDLKTKGFVGHYTMAKKGTIRVTMNPDFKLKKIEYGVPRVKTDADGSKAWDEDNSSSLTEGKYNWKKVKNGKKIKLTKEDTKTWENDEKWAEGWSHSNRGTEAEETPVRITYYDKKNKTTSRETIYIVRVLK